MILSKLDKLKQGVPSVTNFIVEPPSNRTHGDIYTNVAMVLAKHEKKKPVEIAEASSSLLILISLLVPSIKLPHFFQF